MSGSKYSIKVTEETKRDIDPVSFASLIDERFHREEMEIQLVSKLGFDPANLPGETKVAKAFALVDACASQERLIELWNLCHELRPRVNWDDAFKKKKSKHLPGKNWLNLLLIGLVGLIVGGVAGYFLSSKEVTTTTMPSSQRAELRIESDYIIYDFEECADLEQDWQIDTTSSDPLECVQSFAFTGQSSLAVPLHIQKREDINSPVGTTQLWLQNDDLTNKLLLLRIFVPVEAPATLVAHLMVADEEGKIHFGPLSSLKPGTWNSLVWSIEAYPELSRLKKMGIEFKIEGENLLPEQNQFTGTVYIDAVEVYNNPSTQIANLVSVESQRVSGTDFYSFEEEIIPDWDFDPELGTPVLTDTVALAGRQALVFKPNVTARETSDHGSPARFLLDLPQPVQDRLAIFRIYIPEDSPQNLYAQTMVVSNEGDGEWYPIENLQPGEWRIVVRSMKDVPAAYTPQKVGLQFIVEFPDGPNTVYCLNEGPPPEGFEDEECLEDFFVYLDSVEILPQSTLFQDSRTSDTIYYDFEDGIGSEWNFYNQVEGEPVRSSDHVFDGQYSLAINANLRAREEEGDPLAAASIHLQGLDVTEKGVIFHVFVPQDAPTNLAAQFSLADHAIDGPFTYLQPGIWNTIAWSTSDAPLWEGPDEIELHLILGEKNPEVETDKVAFDGLVYLDGIEIIPLYRNYKSARPLESVLKPVFSYNFNDGIVPELFYKSQVTFTTAFTVAVLEIPTRQNALQLDLNLPALREGEPIETYGGGFCVPLDGQQAIDAANVSILLLDDSDTATLQARFTAQDESGNWYFSGFTVLTAGEWVPLFWGTDFGYFVDQWYEWDGRRPQNLCLWLTSQNGYQGSVYIDNFIGYQVNE